MKIINSKWYLNSNLGRLLIIIVLFLQITGCGQKKAENSDVSEIAADTLAMVNNTPITQQHVEVSIEKNFSQIDLLMANPDIERKVLESLVASAALAELSKQQISIDKLEKIKIQTQLYQEELLLRAYLEEYSSPQPVLEKTVLNYYNANLALFGQETLYVVSWLKIDENISANELTDFLKMLPENWNKYASKNRSSPFVTISEQSLSLNTLSNPLANALKNTQVGSVSIPVSEKGYTHRFFLKSNKINPAKELVEVSSQIRKRLAATQIRKELKQLTEKALSEANVKYF